MIVGAQTGVIKLAMAGTQISGTKFLHCWIADYIWLEHAEPSITKR